MNFECFFFSFLCRRSFSLLRLRSSLLLCFPSAPCWHGWHLLFQSVLSLHRLIPLHCLLPSEFLFCESWKASCFVKVGKLLLPLAPHKVLFDLTNEGFSSFGEGGSEMFVPELGSELLLRIDESVDLARLDFDRIYLKFGPQSIEELIIIGLIYCESRRKVDSMFNRSKNFSSEFRPPMKVQICRQ